MPIYEYECEKCRSRFEVRQGFDDEPITECENDGCTGPVRRVFTPPAIIFKGSGFYVTDYGRGNSRGAKEPSPGPTSSEETSSQSETD